MKNFLGKIPNPLRLIQIGSKVNEAITEIRKAKAESSPGGAHITRDERLALYAHGVKLLAELGLPLDIFKGLDEVVR